MKVKLGPYRSEWGRSDFIPLGIGFAEHEQRSDYPCERNFFSFVADTAILASVTAVPVVLTIDYLMKSL